MTNSSQLTLSGIVTKAAIVHTVTYFVAGALAYMLFDYKALWDEPWFNVYMRRLDDPVLMAGPLFQPIRGILFGFVFYLFRHEYFERKFGWLTMWIAMVVMGMICTFGPSPGSIEGLIYSTLPLSVQIGGGSIETFAQAFSLSVVLFYWVRKSENLWLTWGLISAFLIVLVFTVIGLIQSN